MIYFVRNLQLKGEKRQNITLFVAFMIPSLFSICTLLLVCIWSDAKLYFNCSLCATTKLNLILKPLKMNHHQFSRVTGEFLSLYISILYFLPISILNCHFMSHWKEFQAEVKVKYFLPIHTFLGLKRFL